MSLGDKQTWVASVCLPPCWGFTLHLHAGLSILIQGTGAERHPRPEPAVSSVSTTYWYTSPYTTHTHLKLLKQYTTWISLWTHTLSLNTAPSGDVFLSKLLETHLISHSLFSSDTAKRRFLSFRYHLKAASVHQLYVGIKSQGTPPPRSVPSQESSWLRFQLFHVPW